jgi:WD40 repeat protein
MRAQLRSDKSIFCVPTVITRRQRGPESEPLQTSTRAINKVPYRVHDAPGVGGDFYLQQMAAASGRDQLAIVLGEAVYGMRWCEPGHTVLAMGQRGSIGSVAFAQGASRLLSVGTSSGIELYDASVERGNAIVVYHTNITGGRRAHSSMAWRDDNVFAVGQGDADVSVWDVRAPPEQALAHTLSSHRGVVCGLAFGSRRPAGVGRQRRPAERVGPAASVGSRLWRLSSTAPPRSRRLRGTLTCATCWRRAAVRPIDICGCGTSTRAAASIDATRARRSPVCSGRRSTTS